MKTLIVIPVKNEVDTIGKVIDKLKSYGWNDILVIDDQSTDNTVQIVKGKKVDLVSLPIFLGAWGASQTGMHYGLKKGYDIVVTVDADDQHDLRYIKNLVDEIEKNNADIVIGSCPQRADLPKRLLWHLLRKVSGLDLCDITSGFRAYRSTVLRKLLTDHGFILEYQDVGVLLICKNNGAKIKEIPVKMRDRAYGRSRVFSDSLSIFKYAIFTLLYSVFFRQINFRTCWKQKKNKASP